MQGMTPEELEKFELVEDPEKEGQDNLTEPVITRYFSLSLSLSLSLHVNI
jgi:hypothetical protein